jgi:nicotinamidase-related amidase
MNHRILFGTIVLLAGLWIPAVGEEPRKPMVPDAPPRAALLVIDIQNEYLPTMDQKDVKPGMETINTAIDMFRKYGCPVIRVYHSEIGQGPMPGSEAFEFPKTVPVGTGDPQIIKNYPSAFTKTSLDSLLKAEGCNSVYLCGLSAVGCALATYFGAMDRGYETYMIREALISHNADYTNVIRNITGALPIAFVELNLKVLSDDVARLEKASPEVLRNDYGITTPNQLNIIGYNLIFKDRVHDAIIVMKTNMRLFPDEPNCYDSLGDAYVRNNQKDLALSQYETACRMAKEKNDPNLPAYEKNLQRLKDLKK